MLKKAIFLFQILVFLGCSRNPDIPKKPSYQKIENLKAFAKVYGYIRYFHPSDEASEINWDYLAIYGASQIEKCTSKSEVVSTLNDIFLPLAPSAEFYVGKSPLNYDLQKITPTSTEKYELTYWQHEGVNPDKVNDTNSTYASIRVNRAIVLDTLGSDIRKFKLFEYKPKFGEVIERQIADSIFCRIPLVLYTTKESTYPSADAEKFLSLKKKLDDMEPEATELAFRLGNVINLYNVFQHFFPYMDVVDVDWDKELEKALLRCYTDRSQRDHIATLQMFTSPLGDGHTAFGDRSRLFEGSWDPYVLPISWQWIEGKLVVTDVYGDGLPVKKGDIVEQIGHEDPQLYFDKVYARISAGTKGWLNHRAELLSLLGEKDSELDLRVNGHGITLQRDKNFYDSKQSYSPYQIDLKIINDSVFYLNLTRIDSGTIDYLMPQLEKAKSIIWDLRGYPNMGNYKILANLVNENDTTKTYMQIPQIIYPDRKFSGYKTFPLMFSKKIAKPYLGDKQNIFLTDGSAISAAESIMIYVKGYGLATIIGQPTAGADGMRNDVALPGGIKMGFTGTKMVKFDGSQLYGVGILPDIYANQTIEGFRAGRDDILEKAIELTKK